MPRSTREKRVRARSTGHRRAYHGIWPGAAVAAAVLFVLVVLKNAWVCDDAYIIFRSIEQLFAGNGPVWNPHERVQAFTSPLWFWLLSLPRIVSPDVWLNAILVSIALVVAGLVFVRRALHNHAKFVIAVLLLVCCNGVLDFTTSGLENPLAYALIAFYVLHYIRLFEGSAAEATRSFSRLALAFGLVAVTRHDLSLLLLPSLAHAVVKRRAALGRREWASLTLLSCGPLAAWSLFALFYYGSIFPNPAFAKLNAGIPAADLIRQGGRYLVASLRYDTLAILIVIAAIGAALVSRRTWTRWLALGVVANIAYVICVGGDFMLGRFLSHAYFVSVLTLLLCVDLRGAERPALAAAALIVYALAYPHTPVNSGRGYSNQKKYFGIADERGVFFNDTSIYRYIAHAGAESGTKTPYFPDQAAAKRGYDIGRGPYKLTDSTMIGFFGYWCGTGVIIVDRLGLADPLLARLPAANRNTWRIGHFERAPVPGYYESLARGTTEIKDPKLNEFYRKIKLITQAPLLAPGRIQTVLASNLGRLDHDFEGGRQ